jgi:type I restriction enzyme, S subunit
MRNSWPLKMLGDCVDIASGQVDPTRSPFADMPHVGGDNIESHTGRITNISTALRLGMTSAKYSFTRHDVLYSKIRPNLNKVAAPDFDGICSADIYPLRPKAGVIAREFLVYLLRSSEFLDFAEKHSARTNIPKINREALLTFAARLPPLAEQKRIAGILDQADAVRRKRQQALALTDQFLRATFLDMFGDPVTNPKRWPLQTLKSMLSIPLRNGLSPASAGTFQDRVLALSAITQGPFNADAAKNAAFADSPPVEKRVDRLDFLICRGNGNLNLCGVGRFPTNNLQNVVFPDTMIAARIDPTQLCRHYLESLWGTQAVRKQIESGARTTNGTHKVNQQVLEAMTLVVPPIALQQRFGSIVEAAIKTRARQESPLVMTLFDALVQRAFSGSL